MFQIPSGIFGAIWNIVSLLLADFSPFIYLVLGIVLFFWLIEIVFGWLEDLSEKKDEALDVLTTTLRKWKISPAEARTIAKKISKPGQRALELHRKFIELMKQEGVSVSTK